MNSMHPMHPMHTMHTMHTMHPMNPMHIASRRSYSFTLRSAGSVAIAAAAGAFALPASAAPADEPLTIRAVAPSKSFLMVAADDVRGSVERFKKTPLYGLWSSERVQSAVAEEWKEFEEAQKKRLQELGLPEDTMSWPVNGGMALFLERNEELDTLEPQFLAMFDWGDGADKMAAYFEASTAEYAKEAPDRVSTKEIRGRKAWIYTPESPAGVVEGGAFGGMGADAMPKMENIVMVRDGSRFLFSSGTYAMEDALTAIDVPQKTLITDQDDTRSAIEQLGTGDVVGILRTGPLAPWLNEGAAGPAAMVAPMLGQLFGDIQAFGFSGIIDGPVGMLDGAVTIYTPGERKGLLTLLSASPVAPAPAIVPQDAIGYGRINFAFSGLMRVVESVVAGLPEFMAADIESSLQMYGPTLTKAFAALGPDINVYTMVSQPITDDSQSNTIAITCSDEQAVIPLINMFAPMMGYQSRDFVGQTIFSAEGMPMAIGFGGGHMIVGTTSNVEQALRASAQPGGAGASRPGAEQAALSLLPSRPTVSWGWYDTVAGLEVARQLALASGSTDSDLADFIDEQGKAMKDVLGVDKVPTKMIDSIRSMDAEFLAEYLGPQVWQFTSDSRGFAYRVSLLRPKKAAENR